MIVRHLGSRRRAALFAGLGFVATLALTTPSAAQSPEEIKIARQTAGEGFAAYKTNEFEKALGLFDQARALYPSAQILRMAGYSELALERWEKAAASLEGALASTLSPLDDATKKDVQEQLAKALNHLATVAVSSRVPDTTLKVDDGPARPLPLDRPLRLLEGKHRFTVSAPEHIDATDELKLEGGKLVELPLDPTEKAKPKPPPVVVVAPPPPPPKKGWIPHQKMVGYGVTGAGVAASATALIITISSLQLQGLVKKDVDDHLARYGQGCAKGDARLCAFDIAITNDEADRADALRSAGIGLGIGAGVLVAAGVVLVVAAPKTPKPAATEPGVTAPPPPTAKASPTLACSFAGLGGVSCAGTF
jgi:tetratricopeptide (TPR) repeat protein